MAIEQRLNDVDARVVESVVLRGDISALSNKDRAVYYARLCESLGLNPAATPFAALKLNGKEILYATRGATDQLAAIHRINREIIDGPRVMDLAGSKLVYAVCKATHPNGRVETAVATVPLADLANVLMKCETKAKRRATLSILGLGMLDETELETIPASAKETVRDYGPEPENDLDPEAVSSEVARVLSALPEKPVLADLARAWIERRSQPDDPAAKKVWQALTKVARDEGVGDTRSLRDEVNRLKSAPVAVVHELRDETFDALVERTLTEPERERDVIEDVRVALDATVDLASVVAVHKEHEAEASRQERSKELFALCMQALAAHTGQSEERAGKALLAALGESPKDRDFCGADDDGAWMQRLVLAKNYHEQIAAFRKRETLFRRRGLAAQRHAALVTAIEQRAGIAHDDAEALVMQELAKGGAK